MPTEIAEENGSGSNSGIDTASPAGSITQSIATNASRDPGAASGGSQTGSHQSFRRYYFLGLWGQAGWNLERSSCDGGHSFWYGKVRCDAASLGVPCTNCQAFQIECKIPAPKRKKVSGAKAGAKEDGMHVITRWSYPPCEAKADFGDGRERCGSTQGPSPSPILTTPSHNFNHNPAPNVTLQSDGTHSVTESEAVCTRALTDTDAYAQFIKPNFTRAPIKEAGRVAYLGESSNLSLLVRDSHGASDTVHYPLPENTRGSRARLTELDTIEIDILHQRGAFLLPPRTLCDELVEAYFKWIAPVVPVINRSRFMRRYHDTKNPPSLLLLQAVLLAGSRVCTNPQLMDEHGSTTPAAMTFYKRAKALYDANYEDDRVTIVQALILMGWYWEGPEDVTKNVFYWSRVATIVAQGSGMHRSVEHSQLSRADKRLWKRIWWTLFTRDRQVAVALGRPVHINTDDSDVPMVTEDDFIDDEPGYPSDYPPDPLHVQFFLHHVKLCEIMGLVLSQQYSVASKARQQNAIDLVQSDLALADWMLHVPQEMRYHVEDKSRQNFWAALLHSTYYTTLCLLHRAHMPPSISSANGQPRTDENAYPSRNIAFRAAAAITSIIDNLIEHDQLRYCPAFTVYSLFSALIMHVYQMRSPNPQVVTDTQKRMKQCMFALKEISKVWVVARMVYTLFESIIGNKALEERLQKTTQRRHHRKGGNFATAIAAQHAEKLTDPVKRKFDEMDIGGLLSGPVQNVSYERSRPQTPAPTLSMQAPNMTPQNRNGSVDMVMGSQSKGNTRSPTPFQGLSLPSTPAPPDLFLVTRSSPPISQSLWENFQPHQLFPEDSGMNHFSPHSNGMMDPVIAGVQDLTQQAINQHMMQQGKPFPQLFLNYTNHPQQHLWPGEIHLDAGPQAGSSPDDTWSNSSRGGIVPTMLNVEDWFNFFGLNGEVSTIGAEGNNL
ncbi:fungal-specific transcription factor domain-containing protein [Terfezia claveryi]|nr:fungal-specific transcription factor domain-containing protein [Terfezia claveryi]